MRMYNVTCRFKDDIPGIVEAWKVDKTVAIVEESKLEDILNQIRRKVCPNVLVHYALMPINKLAEDINDYTKVIDCY